MLFLLGGKWIVARFDSNPSNSWHCTQTSQMGTSWWCQRESQGITKSLGFILSENTNKAAHRFHRNLSDYCRDFSVGIKLLDQPNSHGPRFGKRGLWSLQDWVMIQFTFCYSVLRLWTCALVNTVLEQPGRFCFVNVTNLGTRGCSVHDKSSNVWKKMCCTVNAFGPSVLPANKLSSRGSERMEEWLNLDSVTDLPPDCLVDSLDDADSGIVLFYFLEVEHRGCLEITKTTIISAPSHGNGKNTCWLLAAVCIKKREPSGAYFQIRLI